MIIGDVIAIRLLVRNVMVPIKYDFYFHHIVRYNLYDIIVSQRPRKIVSVVLAI